MQEPVSAIAFLPDRCRNRLDGADLMPSANSRASLPAMKTFAKLAALAATALLAPAIASAEPMAPTAKPAKPVAAKAAAATPATPASSAPTKAEVGKAAPDFALKADGEPQPVAWRNAATLRSRTTGWRSVMERSRNKEGS